MRRALLWAGVLLVLSAWVQPTFAQDMRFRWVPLGSSQACGTACPMVIEAQGTITTATPRAFAEFMANSREMTNARPVIVIHSPGGVLAAGIRLGLMFRRMNASVFVGRFANLNMLVEAGAVDGQTAAAMMRQGRAGDRAVNGACVSACVYAFLGGQHRFVPARSRLGVHKPFRAEDRYEGSPSVNPAALQTWDRRDVMGMQRAFIEAMGADPELVRVELGTPSNRIRYLTPAEMRRLRLVTART